MSSGSATVMRDPGTSQMDQPATVKMVISKPDYFALLFGCCSLLEFVENMSQLPPSVVDTQLIPAT